MSLWQRREQQLTGLGGIWDLHKDRLWDENFKLICRYAEQHGGDPNCPKSYKLPPEEDPRRRCGNYDGPIPKRNLGAWLHRQRQAKKKGKLPKSRVERLEQLGVHWEPEDAFWERKLQALIRYAEVEGNIPNCAQGYVTPHTWGRLGGIR